MVVQKDLVDEIKESPSGSSEETWRRQLDRRLLMGQDAFVLLFKGAPCGPGLQQSIIVDYSGD